MLSRTVGVVVVLGLAGCVVGDALLADEDPRVATFDPEVTICPIDPDAYIGGDASAYECPDYWICEDLANGEKRCYSPGADQPDDGQWSCWDQGGSTLCRGSDLPDDGGGSAWDCRSEGEFVICENDNPDYPDGQGDGPWDCFFADEFRVCDSGVGDSGDGSGGDSSGGDNGGGSGGSDNPGDNGGGSGGSDNPGDNGGGSGNPGTPGNPGGGDGFGGECVNYYAAKWDGGGTSACVAVGDGRGIFCLDGETTGLANGCDMASVSGAGGNVTVTLPSNCQLIEAASKCATTCEGANMSGAGGTFLPCGGHAISHTEAIWCCS